MNAPLPKSLRIAQLPAGRYDSAGIFSPLRSVEVIGAVVLIRVNDTVYAARQSRDLVAGWGMNDRVRRAWCRLSGCNFKELKERIKKESEAARKREQSDAQQRLRAQAGRAGYRLVKIND